MAVRRKRNYWEECGPVVGTSAALGFMVGGGMAALGVTVYALTPGMRGQRWRFYKAYLPKTVLQGGGAFACFLGLGALVRCL
jgi:hypothetical protein